MKLYDRLELDVLSHKVPHGEAWLARDGGKKVLVFLPGEDAPSVMVDRLRELAASGAPQKLRSPFLAPMTHAAVSEDGRPFVALSPVEGPILADLMVEGAPLTVEAAVKLIGDLLTGLGALSKLKLAHGEVDPRHLHVVEQRQGLGVRLTGLGLNRAAMRAGAAPATSEEEAMAALTFAAPEQARGEVVASSIADVYSAMSILYALITGRAPFEGTSEASLRAAVAKSDPPSLGTLRSELAGPFSEVIDRALASNPRQRFKEIDELQRALRAAVLRAPVVRTLATLHLTLPEAGRTSLVPAVTAPKEPGALELDLEDEDEDEDDHEESTRVRTASDDLLSATRASSDEDDDEDDDEEPEESTRVGDVAPEVLAKMKASGASSEDEDEDDEEEEENEESTRVGGVDARLIAQTLPEHSAANEEATAMGSPDELQLAALRKAEAAKHAPKKAEAKADDAKAKGQGKTEPAKGKGQGKTEPAKGKGQGKTEPAKGKAEGREAPKAEASQGRGDAAKPEAAKPTASAAPKPTASAKPAKDEATPKRPAAAEGDAEEAPSPPPANTNLYVGVGVAIIVLALVAYLLTR